MMCSDMGRVLPVIKIFKKKRSVLRIVVQVPLHKQRRISHAIRRYTVRSAGGMSDIDNHAMMSESSVRWTICQRWRCMRVARIARIKTSKLYMCVWGEGGVVSRNLQQKLEVHTLRGGSKIGTECTQHQWFYHVARQCLRTSESGSTSTGARTFMAERTFVKS
jgi:hypothetical protein